MVSRELLAECVTDGKVTLDEQVVTRGEKRKRENEKADQLACVVI